MSTNTQPVSYETELYKKTELRPNLEHFLIPTSKTFPDHYRLFQYSTKEITLIERELWDSRESSVKCNSINKSFYNSKENPITLRFNKFKDFLYTEEVVTYIAVTEFKDTGKVILTCCIQEFCYSSKTKTLFLKKSGKKFINMYIEKDTLIPGIYINGKICYTDYHLDASFNALISLKGPGLEFFNTAFNQKFLCDFNGALIPSGEVFTSNILKIYRVKRSSKLLKQLPWTNINHLTSLYSYTSTRKFKINAEITPDKMHIVFARYRESILVSLRKGDTKKAVDKIFFNAKLPKSIKKILIKLPIFTFNYEDMVLLEKNLIDHDINVVRTALELTQGPSYIFIIKCIELGFSFKHTINTYKKDYHLLQDTLRYVRFMQNIPAVENHTIKEYHDMLDAVRREEYNRNRYINSFSQNYTELFKATKTDSIYSPQEVGDYIFRSPITVNELETVSSKLNICVRAYQKEFFLRTLDIVLVVDKDSNEYVGCIELRSNNVAQAKLKYNRLLREDESILNATNTWISTNNLEINTKDLIENLEHRVIDNPPIDTMRLEILKSWVESKKQEYQTSIRDTSTPAVIIDDTIIEANNPW